MGMDPLTMALVGGTAMKAFGSIQQGNAAGQAGKYNANIEYQNARIARENAEYASQKGEAAVEKSTMETRAKVGGIIADQGASGVQIGGKSFTDVRASAAEIGALNALNIRSNAAREAYGYQVEEASANARAKMHKMEAHQAKIAGWTDAATTVLSTAASPAGQDAWGKMMGSKSLSGGKNAGWIDWNNGESTFSG